MKVRILTTTALLSAIAFSTPALSQPSATGQYQPGFWQPEVQVDNSRNIKVRLLNDTGLNLEYGESGVTISSLPPGATREFNISISNRTGDIANIPINVKQGITALKYEYNVDPAQNLVTVRIRLTSDRERQDRAIYIDERGRVYSF